MSDQDIPYSYNRHGVGGPFDFPLSPLDSEFLSEIPSVEPISPSLFNGFGRPVITHSTMSHPGLGRGRMPVINPFFRPLVDMHEELQINPPFLDQTPHLYLTPRLTNPAPRVRTDPPAPLLRASLPQPPPQPTMRNRNRKRRASEKAISELKHMRLIDLKEDDDCCIICMETFVDIKSSTDEPKSENALQMPCGHVFGSHCLKLWLKDHSTCPTCRKEVDFVEEGGRGERAVWEINRRRGIIARRQLQNGQNARESITAAMQHHQDLEVELIVQQRQRIAATRMDPAAREHGGEDASWTHALLQQQNSHYSPFLDMFSQGRDPIHEVEPMDNRHQHPASRHPRVPHIPQALPRPPTLQTYHNHPRAIHRMAPPQGIFGPGHMFTQRQHPTMPQHSQSRGQSQRQSPYFEPYSGVNLAGRESVPLSTGSADGGLDSSSALGDSLRGPVSGCTLHPNNSQNNPHDVPVHRQDHPQNHQYPGLGGDMSLINYMWEPNGQLQHHHHHHQYQHQHQRQHPYHYQPQHPQHQQHQACADSSQQISVNHLPGPSSPTYVDGPTTPAPALHQHDQQKCAYIEMGMCQHLFSLANDSGFSAGGTALVAPEMAQIVHLNCGHGFHRACLLSTKNRVPRTTGSAAWLCGRCGKYGSERGMVDGRQQVM